MHVNFTQGYTEEMKTKGRRMSTMLNYLQLQYFFCQAYDFKNPCDSGNNSVATLM